jgi:ribose 5-phosphate isomerase B
LVDEKQKKQYTGDDMKIAIGSDKLGAQLRRSLIEHLQKQSLVKVEIQDFGVGEDDEQDYPDIGLLVAESIANGTNQRGILICGTGIGMAITANKVPGVYAANVSDSYSAERARKSNNAQVITFGALTVGVALANSLIDIWLVSEFQGGRSTRKVEKIKDIEAKYNELEEDI